MTPPPRPAPPRRQSSLNPDSPAAHRRQRKQSAGTRQHGWARASDVGPGGGKPTTGVVPPPPKPKRRRRTDGTPLLMLTVLGVITAVGLAKVQAQTRVLELGEEIGRLTDERAALLDRKRRLETERSFLRHPDRIRRQAVDRLQMEVAPPERRQEIELLTNTEDGSTRALLSTLGRPEQQP